MTVKPTTAYVGDNTEGKLTLYVPYYGVTGIGQITLSASGAGNVQLHSNQLPMEVLTKSATDNSASVTFSLEGDDAYSSSGRVLIDNNYTLKNLQEHSDGKSYEEGCGFSSQLSSNGSDGWITTNGSLTPNGDGTYTQHFTLGENTSTTSPRTGAVVVFSPSGREVTRFVIKQNAKDAETIKPTSLVTDKSANCYIITSPGTYELPAYMGAHNSLTGQKKYTGKPYEVWNDGNNTINLLYKSFSDNKIVFEIPNQIKAGNAVIAIRDENDVIQWSWHLWFSESQPGTFKYPAGADGVRYDVMDRALGATHSLKIGSSSIEESLPSIFKALWNTIKSALSSIFEAFIWNDGLYYQYGRKDPFSDVSTANVSTSSNVTHDNTIQNPTTFYSNWNPSTNPWGESKSVNDPCPPGYKVPSSNVWRAENPNKDGASILNVGKVPTTTSSAYTYYISDDLSSSVFFPYTYHLNSDGSKAEKISRDEPALAENFNPRYEPKSTVLTPYKFRNVYYKAPVAEWYGGLWSSSETSLAYYYREADVASNGWDNFFKQMKITSIQYCKGKCSRSGSIFSGGYTYTYTYEDETKGEDAWKTLDDSDFHNLSITWGTPYQDVNAELQTFLNENGLGGKNYGYKPQSSDRAKSNALPIRCLKE